MRTDVTWKKGGTAEVVAISADTIRLRSTIPSPPGSRIEGELGDGVALWVKIHGSKKQEDGAFVLDGRPLDLTKAVRERLVALVTAAVST